MTGSDASGNSVSSAGDVSGDGFADLLVGAWLADEGGTDRGAAYVVFGSPTFGTPVIFSKDHKMATFTDQSHYLVTVKITKGQFAPSNFQFAADGATLQRLDLSATQFVHDGGHAFRRPTVLNGSALTITAKTVGFAGTAEVRMGAIDAHGLDLSAVTVAGSIEQIDAGDANVRTAGIKSLTVHDIAAGVGTNQYHAPDAHDPYHSIIVGALGSFTVKNDLNDAVIDVTGGTFGTIGKITVGHAINGLTLGNFEQGVVRASGNIGPVSVTLGIFGGVSLTGILAGGRLGAVTVGELNSSDLPVVLSALGNVAATKASQAVAIASVTVKCNVKIARILAGYTIGGDALNPDAGIGAITVGGDWSTTSVAAGVNDATGDGFGRNDTLIGGDTTPAISATIASITIKAPRRVTGAGANSTASPPSDSRS